MRSLSRTRAWTKIGICGTPTNRLSGILALARAKYEAVFSDKRRLVAVELGTTKTTPCVGGASSACLCESFRSIDPRTSCRRGRRIGDLQPAPGRGVHEGRAWRPDQYHRWRRPHPLRGGRGGQSDPGRGGSRGEHHLRLDLRPGPGGQDAGLGGLDRNRCRSDRIAQADLLESGHHLAGGRFGWRRRCRPGCFGQRGAGRRTGRSERAR